MSTYHWDWLFLLLSAVVVVYLWALIKDEWEADAEDSELEQDR